MSALREQIANLTAAEKAELLDEVWESLEAEALTLSNAQRAELDALSRMNQEYVEKHPGISELTARISSYELAFRMQGCAPEAINVDDESDETKRLYGLHEKTTEIFGRQCLMARQLIERQEGKFEPADIEDRYESRLREVIDAKLKGEGIAPEAQEEPRGDNVIDLMAALKRSLGAGTRAKKKAKRTVARKRA